MRIRWWASSSNDRTLVTKTTVELFLVFRRKIFNTDPLPTDKTPVCRRYSFHCLFGIFEKDVSKARRISCHPYVTNLTKATVRPKKFVFATVVTKITYYYSRNRHQKKKGNEVIQFLKWALIRRQGYFSKHAFCCILGKGSQQDLNAHFVLSSLRIFTCKGEFFTSNPACTKKKLVLMGVASYKKQVNYFLLINQPHATH